MSENVRPSAAVFACGDTARERALSVARSLGLPLYDAAPQGAAFPLVRVAEDGISLVCGAQELKGDFSRMLRRARKSNLREELIVRAVKLKDAPCPRVIDATAGLGEDSFLLAASGCEVTLFERDEIIALLLEDALERGKNDPLAAKICANMRLEKRDSIPAMRALETPPDVIFLDPMFPEREKSALVKKKLQLIKQLEPPCTDEAELFCAAVAARPRRIVVKRPPKGAFLAGRKPDHSLTGKAVRFDCYTVFSR